MKFLFLFTLPIYFMFSGCSVFSIDNYLNKDEFYINSLKYTKKADIVENNEVLAMFTVSYLNRFDEEYDTKNENFLVSSYFTEAAKEKNFIFNIELNENKPLSMVKLLDEDRLVVNSSLKNSWADFYLVEFENIKYDNEDNYIYKLDVNISVGNTKEVHLDFEKRY